MTNPNQEPTPEHLASRLTSSIDNLIETNSEYLTDMARDFEQELVLDAPMTFEECPTATRLMVSRPMPGKEQESYEKWGEQSGYRISVVELGGRIQTDFLIEGQTVLRRQIVHSENDSLLRRSEELLGDALSLDILDGIEKAIAVREKNLGKEASPDVVGGLIAWLRDAEPAGSPS